MRVREIHRDAGYQGHGGGLGSPRDGCAPDQLFCAIFAIMLTDRMAA
jgi:hypothetical protein